MPDLDRVEELDIPIKLQKDIRAYDEPGLFVAYRDPDSELNSDADSDADEDLE